jgi:hypothetical protein
LIVRTQVYSRVEKKEGTKLDKIDTTRWLLEKKKGEEKIVLCCMQLLALIPYFSDMTIHLSILSDLL